MPLVAHHFGEVTPAAPVGNLVLVPLVELAVLPCGLVGALLALVHPVLGAAPLWIAGMASQAALYGADGFRRLTPIIFVRYPNLLESAALVASAGCLLYGLSRGTGRRMRWLLSALLAGSLAAGSLVVRDLRRKSADELRVTFIDMGQGDSALLEGPGGFVMLVDGGGRYDDSFDTGARVVEPVLRARGIGRIDSGRAFPSASRPSQRFAARAGTFRGGHPVDQRRRRAQPKVQRAAGAGASRGVATPVPAGFDKEGVRVEPLGPWVGDVIGPPPGLDANNASLVVRASYAGHAVLFTGDIGVDGEAELVARGGKGLAIASDVLKVPITAAGRCRETSSWPPCSQAWRWFRWASTTPSICPARRPWPDTPRGAQVSIRTIWKVRSRRPVARKAPGWADGRCCACPPKPPPCFSYTAAGSSFLRRSPSAVMGKVYERVAGDGRAFSPSSLLLPRHRHRCRRCERRRRLRHSSRAPLRRCSRPVRVAGR